MIVLHTTRYGDSSIIVHGYTSECGRESFLLHGASGGSTGRKRRHATSLLHPLSLLDVTASGHSGGGMRHIKEFSPRARLDSIRNDVRKSSIAMFISEVLYRTLLNQEQDPGMYAFIEDAVLRLEASDGECANFHLWFMVRYAEVLGFGPAESILESRAPFDDTEIPVIRKISGTTLEESLRLPLSGRLRGALAASLVSYIGAGLGMNVRILSLPVLHDVFAG